MYVLLRPVELLKKCTSQLTRNAILLSKINYLSRSSSERFYHQ